MGPMGYGAITRGTLISPKPDGLERMDLLTSGSRWNDDLMVKKGNHPG